MELTELKNKICSYFSGSQEELGIMHKTIISPVSCLVGSNPTPSATDKKFNQYANWSRFTRFSHKLTAR